MRCKSAAGDRARARTNQRFNCLATRSEARVRSAGPAGLSAAFAVKHLAADAELPPHRARSHTMRSSRRSGVWASQKIDSVHAAS